MPKLHSMFVALALLAGPSCTMSDSNLVRVNGTVRHFSFEGGFWAVRGDDSTTYEPVDGLPPSFQEDGLRVFLEAKNRPDLGGIHGAGPIVEILTIRRL